MGGKSLILRLVLLGCALLPCETFTKQLVTEVSTQAEFIAAIGNDRTIFLKGDIYLTNSTFIQYADTGIVIPAATTGLVIEGNGFSIDGGVVMRCMYIGNVSDVEVNNLTITRGNARMGPDGADGGGLYLDSDAKANFDNCNFTSNQAGFEGGAILIDYNATANFQRCQILKNKVGENFSGGGVFLYFARANFMSCLIKFNTAYSGGGVEISGNGATAHFYDSQISSNSADRGGGVCVTYEAVAYFNNTQIMSNVARRWGGGVHVLGGLTVTTANLNNSEVFSNKAGGGGGGIYVERIAMLNCYNSHITSNLALVIGGALNVDRDATASCHGVEFSNNSGPIESGKDVHVEDFGTFTASKCPEGYETIVGPPLDEYPEKAKPDHSYTCR